MEANNMKAMREEVSALLAWAENNLQLSPDLLKEGTRECCEFVVACCKSALAKPPRNCDVGTLEDRVDRFARYCEKNGECKTCPAYLKGDMDCHIAWSDMPYNESEKPNA